MYFSFFSTATLIASVILFHGLGTTGGVNTFTLFCGFYTISMGVYLIVRPLSPSRTLQNAVREP